MPLRRYDDAPKWHSGEKKAMTSLASVSLPPSLMSLGHDVQPPPSSSFLACDGDAPLLGRAESHRKKVNDNHLGGLLCGLVAKTMTPKDIAKSQVLAAAFKASDDVERRKLDAAGVFDWNSVMEYGDAVKAARRRGFKTHVGRIFIVRVLKNHELGDGGTAKSRAVYDGSYVKDSSTGGKAVFDESSSTPACIESARNTLTYGCLKGHTCQSADGVAAYLQAPLRARGKGIETLARPPREWVPQRFQHLVDPVVPMLKALYGHPEAGEDWAQHSKAAILSVGFVEVPGFPSTYWHNKLRTVVCQYVDDFMVSGPATSMKSTWQLLRSVITMDEPEPTSRFLGCRYDITDTTINGEAAKRIRYDMSDYARSTVALFEEAAGEKVRKAATPFVIRPQEVMKDAPATWEQLAAMMQAAAAEELPAGKFATMAPSMVMKIMWLARIARPDLSKATVDLSRRLTCWTTFDDDRLRRLVGYIAQTTTFNMVGHVCGSVGDLTVNTFADADFASSTKSKSTTGAYCEIASKNGAVIGTAWMSKRQGSTARSTPEAEIVAADTTIFAVLLPALEYWKVVGQGLVKGAFHEDNSAALVCMKAGYSATLRVLHRVHRVALQALSNALKAEDVDALECKSENMKADGFTKLFTPATWPHILDLLGIRDAAPK